MQRYVVLFGDPITGFTIHGPFNDDLNAHEWAEQNCDQMAWWVAPLEKADAVRIEQHSLMTDSASLATVSTQ